LRIRHGRPSSDRARPTVATVVDEGKFTRIRHRRIVGERDIGNYLAGAPRSLNDAKIALTGIEGHVERIKLHKCVEREAGPADEGPYGSAIAAEATRKRCTNIRVRKIDLCRPDRRTIPRNRRFALAESAGALVVVVLGKETCLGQFVA